MTLLIDPGHGGNDLGGENRLHPPWHDKAIALATGLQLKECVGSRFEVSLTRDRDRGLTLIERYWKNLQLWEKQPERPLQRHWHYIFLSLHANRTSRVSARGKQVWLYPGHWVEVATKINNRLQAHSRKINYSGIDIWPPQVNHFDVIKLPQLTPHTPNWSPTPILGKIPSLLIELGFMTNPGESALLTKTQHRLELAHAIHLGLLDHFKYKDRRSGVIQGRLVDESSGDGITPLISALSDTKNDKGEPDKVEARHFGDGRFQMRLHAGTWILRFDARHGGYFPIMKQLEVTHEKHELGVVRLKRYEGEYTHKGVAVMYLSAEKLSGIKVLAKQGDKTLETLTKDDGTYLFNLPNGGKWHIYLNDEAGYRVENKIYDIGPPFESRIAVMVPYGSYAFEIDVIGNPLLPHPVPLLVARCREDELYFSTPVIPRMRFHLPLPGNWELTISDFKERYHSKILMLSVPSDYPPTVNDLGQIKLDWKNK